MDTQKELEERITIKYIVFSVKSILLEGLNGEVSILLFRIEKTFERIDSKLLKYLLK